MRYCITICGKVQGVFFRRFTFDKAQELNIRGFVQNMPDGSVYCEAEGEYQDLQLFLDWCGIGSPDAEVTAVDIESKTKLGYVVFEIKK